MKQKIIRHVNTCYVCDTPILDKKLARTSEAVGNELHCSLDCYLETLKSFSPYTVKNWWD